MALAEFGQHYPGVSVEILNGNREELYNDLRNGTADIILNDQRRAFSDAYVNQILITSECYIEISGRSPLAPRDSLTAKDLKPYPCIEDSAAAMVR